MVSANVEQSYISLKPKVTLFKGSMAQGMFQSMAIFFCVIPFVGNFGDHEDIHDCNVMKYSSQIFRMESNSRVSAMEIMVFLRGSFPFVQLKSDIQRFDPTIVSSFPLRNSGSHTKDS